MVALIASNVPPTFQQGALVTDGMVIVIGPTTYTFTVVNNVITNIVVS